MTKILESVIWCQMTAAPLSVPQSGQNEPLPRGEVFMFPEVSVFLSNEIQKSAKVPGRIDQVSVPQGIALAGIVYSNVVSTADPILKIEGLFQDEAVRRTLAPLFEEARKIEVRLSLRNNSDRSRSILAEMIFVGAAQDSINQVCFFTIDPISGIRYVRPLDDN